jgi:hypothetical protein
MPGVAGRSGGQNRKTTAEHVLAGTYRPGRHGSLAVLPPPAGRDANDQQIRRLLRGLSGSSRNVGRTLLDEFTGWTTPDLAVLRLLLEELDRGAACRRAIEAEGMVLRGKRGVARPHPLLRAERQSRALAASLFKQLGHGGVK